ncbi:MAG: UbiA family prenyltransferase [Xanthomonadaceae bacterium]|nr:UbiA family prenyltransferase [Xanthomonadaceae bacterium]
MSQNVKIKIQTKQRLLFVDLDGTVCKTDILLESLISCVRHNFWSVFLFPFWLIKGRAYLKYKAALNSSLKISTLPWNQNFLEYLNSCFKNGDEIVHATGAHMLIAEKIANELGVFSSIIATKGNENLIGLSKLKKMQSYSSNREFFYAGNDYSDWDIWKASKGSILVNCSSRLTKQCKKEFDISREFISKSSKLTNIFQAIRVRQWVKNSLVFVPVILSHQFFNTRAIYQSFIVFIAFCLCASSVYLVNDLMDLESDREHPRKKNRPMASGSLDLRIAMVLAPLLAGASIFLMLKISIISALLVLSYILITFFYTFYIKKLLLFDVFLVGSLYSFRVYAGGISTEIPVSSWFLFFSSFLFLSLAFLKRYIELKVQPKISLVSGRGYIRIDTDQIREFGIVSGYVSVLILALYVKSPEIQKLYSWHEGILLICPLLLFWLNRIWLLAGRSNVDDDPVAFAVQDKTTYVVVVLCLAIFIISSLNKVN